MGTVQVMECHVRFPVHGLVNALASLPAVVAEVDKALPRCSLLSYRAILNSK